MRASARARTQTSLPASSTTTSSTWSARRRGGLDKLKGFDIFRTSDGTTWEKVVSDGFNVGPERNIVGWLTEFKGELYLAGQTMDPRILIPTQPSERIPPKGFQLYRSSDGANWTQVGKDGFGADSSYTANMMVLGGLAYLGVYDYHEGNQLWKSTDGKDWELIFRQPYPSWFERGQRTRRFPGPPPLGGQRPQAGRRDMADG